MIKLIDLLRENIESNIFNDAKETKKLGDFLEKYSTKGKKFGTYESHGFISLNDNNQPYIRLNDKIIEVTPSGAPIEYYTWDQLKLKPEYNFPVNQPVLLKYTAEYSDAQVVDGHHRVKYIIDKDINGQLGWVLDDESLIDLWNRFPHPKPKTSKNKNSKLYSKPYVGP